MVGGCPDVGTVEYFCTIIIGRIIESIALVEELTDLRRREETDHQPIGPGAEMTIEVIGIGPEEVFCTTKQRAIEIDLRKSIDPPEAQPVAGELRTRQLKGGPVDPLPIAHPLYAVLGGADKGMRDQPTTE